MYFEAYLRPVRVKHYAAHTFDLKLLLSEDLVLRREGVEGGHPDMVYLAWPTGLEVVQDASSPETQLEVRILVGSSSDVTVKKNSI